MVSIVTNHSQEKDIWEEPEEPGDEHPEDRSHQRRAREQRLKHGTGEVPVQAQTKSSQSPQEINSPTSLKSKYFIDWTPNMRKEVI